MSEDIKHHHQRAVPISSSRGCLRETNHMRSMRQTVAAPLPSSSLALRGQDEAPTRACLGADSEELLVTTTHRRRRRRRPQDEDLQVVAGTKLNHKSSNIRPPVTETGRHRHCRRHSTHTNWAHMIGPMLYLVLIILNQSVSIYCKPNTSSQQQHNNNHLQQQLQLTDKQLLRKALDSSESSRAQAIGSAITSQSSSSAGGNGGGESLSSTASATTTTTSSTATTLAANGGGNGVRSSASSQNQNQNQGQDGAGNGQFQCPEQFGYYTDTRDCTKYYVCVFGEVLHESCTGGLRFSRELQTCDWPRNVECPNNQTSTTNSESSSSTTASTSALSPSSSSSSPSTTTAATTTTSSTSTSGYSSSTPQPTTTLPGTTSAATTTSTNSPNGIQDNRSKSVNGGNSASLVFADENSDPQQPSFDEAISPVITADGAIHLHDGSGGTFALGPNPNRGIASSAPQSINGPVESGSGGQSSQAERNVDVFVMPLSLGSSSSQSSRGQTVNKQQRARFQQQPNNQNQQQPRLMLHSHNVHSNSPTTTNQQQRQQQQQQPPQHNLRPVPSELNSRNAAELSDESGDFNLNGPGASSSLASSGSEGSNSELEPDNNSSNNNNESDDDLSDQTDGPQSGGQSSPAPSNNGQADRDQADERNLQDNGAPGSLDGGSGASDVGPDQDQYGANNQNNDYNDQTSAGPGQQQPGSHVGNSYIPPVLAAASSSTNENFNSRLFQSGPSSTSTSIAPSSSPGLNNNNNNRQRQQSSALLSVNNRQIVDPSRQTFKPMLTPISSSNNRQQLANNQNTNQNQRSSIQQQQQQSSINANNRQNNQQQLQQLQNNNAQNNRQSRMSSQFAGNDSFNPSSLAPPNPLIASQPTQSSSSQSALTSSAASRFPTNDNSRQSFSNNNFNFNNDSSKLIRLPTSQQQQLFDNNNNNRNSPLTPSFQPRFPQQQQPQQQQPTRSQNTLLFSAQKPGFGFMSTPANPFAGSSAESTGANHTATNLYHDQSPGAGQRHPANEFHQTFAGPQQQQQQGQQQRRSRPPKRQQIPSGSSAPPPSSSSIPVAGRQRQTAGPLLDFDTTTTTSTTMSTPQLNQRERTTLSTAFNNDEQDTRRPPARPQSNFDQQQPPARLQLRPASVVVPPTTVNFRDSSTAFPVTNQPPQQPSRQRQTGGRTNSQLVAPLLDQQLANLRAPTAGSNGVDFNQSPGPTTIVGGSDNSGQLDTTDSLAPTAPTTTGSTSLASAGGSGVGSLDGATTAASQTAPGGGDPQAVANRYLNSAIDALEAGQPFGTVDYDFDILNDNSTDRRAPTPNQNQTAPQQQPQPQVQPARSSRPSSGRSRQQSGSNERSSDGSGQTASVGVGVQQQQPLATTTLAGGNQGGAQAAPTKKPRPTNKKITVNHEQALANIRASAEPAKRPEPLFQTPQPLQQASKCDNRACRLPDCKCGDTLAPGGMDPKVIPQVVLLTFDDAVNDLNWEIYEELFSGRTNPNGCPVLATFYVSHEWTDYGQVQTLYSRGHEMASHSVTHSFGEKFSKSQWFKEINGQREILNMYGGVKMNDVRGMRAPFLQIGGNKMFEMLYDANFTYDSSMPIFENSPPMWPYTLDYQLAHECMITPCPTKSFPGVWEVGMTMWVDLRGGRCSMGDACSNPSDEDGVYEMLMKNFNRHYKSNRAPFGLFYHSAWFNTVHHRRGFLRFMSTVNSLPDVFFVTNWQMLQWMRQPTPISEINSFEPWQCPAKNDRPPPCYHPSVCNVKSEHGTRFMKTCQPCPANQQYPWVGATGFKQSKQNGSG